LASDGPPNVSDGLTFSISPIRLEHCGAMSSSLLSCEAQAEPHNELEKVGKVALWRLASVGLGRTAKRK
jgi:hypothetical protein